MATTSTYSYSLEIGSQNFLLDGVNQGIAQGDVGPIVAMPPRSSRHIIPTNIALQIDITGAPSGVTVTLNGSLDGVNFYPVATYNATTGALYFIANSPVRFWQAVLTTLTGGTTPKVKVSITA